MKRLDDYLREQAQHRELIQARVLDMALHSRAICQTRGGTFQAESRNPEMVGQIGLIANLDKRNSEFRLIPHPERRDSVRMMTYELPERVGCFPRVRLAYPWLRWQEHFGAPLEAAGSMIMIRTAAELINMNNPNGNYRLANDITLQEAWVPYFYMQSLPFRGIFDGAGYVIKNLSGEIGLFFQTDGAVIRNVFMENVNIDAGSTTGTGSIVGHAVNSLIENCGASGTLRAGSWSGGLIGQSHFDRTSPSHYRYIRDLCSNVNVIGASHTGDLGGVVGSVGYDVPVTIERCGAKGNITGGQLGLGGLIGSVNNEQNIVHTVRRSFASGNVSNVSSLDTANIGGLIGEAWGIVIDDCYAQGTVEGLGARGALLGRYTDTWETDRCMMRRCYAVDARHPLWNAFLFHGIPPTVENCHLPPPHGGPFPGWDFEHVWQTGE